MAKKFKYIKTAEERDEVLLRHMMRLAARNCPDSEIQRLTTKLKIPTEEVQHIFLDESFTRKQQMMQLFTVWRKLNESITAIEAQDKLMHAIDLVDFRKVLYKMRAMRIYAKAPKL